MKRSEDNQDDTFNLRPAVFRLKTYSFTKLKVSWRLSDNFLKYFRIDLLLNACEHKKHLTVSCWFMLLVGKQTNCWKWSFSRKCFLKTLFKTLHDVLWQFLMHCLFVWSFKINLWISFVTHQCYLCPTWNRK